MPRFYLDERDVSTRDGLSFYSPFVVTDVIGKDRVNVTLDADLAREHLNVPSIPVLLSQLEDIDQYSFLARVNSGTGDVEEVQLSGSSRINLFPDTGPPPFISWDLVAGSVSNSYLANMSADRIKGRANGAGTGAPQDLTATQVRTILNVADGADNTTASNVGTAGVGVFKQKSGSDLQFKKLNAGSSKLSVTDDTGNDEVDLDVVEANINHDNLTGFVANEHVDHSAVTLTAGDGLSGGGDITASRSFTVNVDGSTIEIATDALQVKDLGITTTKIANDAVTYAKMQNVSATDRLLGRVSASAGDVEEVVCTDFAQSLLDDAAASDARTTLGLGALATGSSAADIAYTPAVLTDWDGDADPGDVDNALDQLAERIDDVEGAVGTGDFYDSVTDGTTTATASGGDTFKLRSASNLLTVAVQNNDATHGDNALFTVNQANIDHDALTNFVANEHVDHTAVTLTAGDGLSGGGDISASRSFAVNVDTTSIEINADTLRRTALTGDVTASAGSSATTIANDAVTNAKLNNMAESRIKGRAAAAGTGDPSDLSASQVRTIINVEDGANNYVHPDHTGDVTSVADGDTTIVNDAVSNAKMANMAEATIKGRAAAAGTGDPTDLTAAQVRTIINVADGATAYTDEMAQDAVGDMVDTTLEYTDGTPLLSRAALTGDVTASAGSNATTIANNAVTTAKIADDNVTYAKIQDVSATDRLLGRVSASAGIIEEVVCTDFAQSLLDDAAASDARTTLGLGTIATVNSPVPVANGGTGQTTKTAAFDELAPTTTKGDIIVSNGSDNIRLGVGSNTQVLTADSAEASGVKWSAAGTGTVVGPGTVTDNRIVRFDGTTGNLIQQSGLSLSDIATDTFSIDRNSGGNTALELTVPATASNFVALTSAASGSPATIASKSTAAPSEDVDLVLVGFNAGLVKANQDGTAREVATISGTQTLTNKTLTTPTIADFTNATHDHSDADDGGLIDASVITFTPTTATDWDGDADPGDVNDALDQLAERVDDLEGAGGGSGDVVGPASAGDSNVALFDGTTGKLLKNSDLDYTSGVLDRPGAELGLGHSGNVAVDDAVHFALGTTTGTKFGTATTQKIGFFNATPVDKPGSTEDIKDALISLGLITSGGATPLDLDGGDITCDDITADEITCDKVISAVGQESSFSLLQAGKARLSTGNAVVGANVGGSVDTEVGNPSNTSTTETTLYTLDVGDTMLDANGVHLHFVWVGTIDTSANNKQLRVKLGSTTIYDSTAQNPGSAVEFILETWIVRSTSASAQKCVTRLTTSVATSFTTLNYTTASENLGSGAVNLVLTAQGGATAEITQTLGLAYWLREK